MKLIKSFENVGKLSNFNDDMFLLYDDLKERYTLINKSDGSFVYDNLWFKKCYDFDNKFYHVKRKDGLSTLINKSDGSFVYDNLWFTDWYNLNDKFYRVKRTDGLFTLINKFDGSLFDDKWYDNITFISNNSFSTYDGNTLNIYSND